ncbi:MAG TPA: hypothetical protein VNJ04_12220 [Gemmatimonadaceae bacterium]|nr:hypothetical protein [Gemmatimonadaceae bacterium]
MARNRYRVTKQLPWIEGGELAPNFEWVGGQAVIYEPGATIGLDDAEVPSIFHCLEATNAAGQAVLDVARARMDGPATVTMLSDFDPKDQAWLLRATREKTDLNRRAEGQYHELVNGILARGDRPSLEDVVAALRCGGTPSQEFLDYVANVLMKPQRPGPTGRPRAIWEDLAINAYYESQVVQARRAYEADSQQSRRFAHVAKSVTAKAFRISTRTVERVLALRPAKRPPS